MSGFTSFAVVGAGGIGSFIVEELLKLKASNKIKNVTILTRSVSTRLPSHTDICFHLMC